MIVAHTETDAAPRPITMEDLLALPVLGDPQMAPDGSRIAYTLTVVDRDANAYRSHLWLVPTGGGEPRQLTTARARETGPRWSPDGTHIAFVSDRGGDKQVWVIPVTGGEARALTTGKLAPAELSWAPDGRTLAFVGKPPLPADSREDSDVRVISRLRYKADGEGFWDGRWKQIFVVPLSGGEARAVTQGDCDHLSPAWSPDGRSLAYTANPDPNADLTNVTDLWVVPVAEPRRSRDASRAGSGRCRRRCGPPTAPGSPTSGTTTPAGVRPAGRCGPFRRTAATRGA